MQDEKLRDRARMIAIELIQQDVDAGHTVESIQQTYHGHGGPSWSARVLPKGKIAVERIDGQEVRYNFSLRAIYAEAKSRQLRLL